MTHVLSKFVGSKVGENVGSRLNISANITLFSCENHKLTLANEKILSKFDKEHHRLTHVFSINVGAKVGDNVGSRVGSDVGSSVGSYVGAGVGSYVGAGVGSYVNDVIGSMVIDSVVVGSVVVVDGVGQAVANVG